jgi:hypothetical protein
MLVAFLFIGSMFWVRRWLRSDRSWQWFETFAGEYVMVLTPAGLSSSRKNDRVTFYTWPEIVAFETSENYFFIYLRRDVALMIPRASLASPEQGDAFAEELCQLWRAHPNNADKVLPALPAPASFFPAQEIWLNVCQAARVACFRPFDHNAFRISRSLLFWAVLLNLLWIGIADYVAALPAPAFSIWGLGIYGTKLLLVFAAAAAVSSAVANRASMLGLLVMITASSLVASLFFLPIYVAAGHWLSGHVALLNGLSLVWMLWFIAIVFRIAGQLYRQPAPSALYLSCLFAVFAFVLSGFLPSHQIYYYNDSENESQAYSRARKLNIEDVFYRQPVLVDKTLAEIGKHRPGKTNLYFIGFAGQAQEKVFANEVRYAKKLLDQRFGAAGHSIALVNDLDTVADAPLANPHNLDAILQGIATRMDKNKDVLFLFLSSHGAKDQKLSVSFWPMEFNDLKAETLKEMLDKSGIKNRVVVVSACYSGGFLDVLKDENTLILTASSRDHVSYGCGDATEYTYFGEAYFVKSLTQRDSFIEAFNDARQLVEAREKVEGKEHAGPQIYVGKNIVQKLEGLEVKHQASQKETASQ